MTLPFSIPNAKPTLATLLDNLKSDIMLNLNCHAVATVESVDAANQTLNASVNYTKTINRQNEDGVWEQVQITYPLLTDIPFLSLCGGGAYLSLPVAQGDQCLILFNDRDLNNWFSGAMSGPVASTRLHDLSDGIALVGLNDIASYDGTNVILANGTAYIKIAPSAQITIANVTTSLGVILTNFMTAMTAFNTALGTAATAFGGNPAIETAAAAGGADLAAAAITLQTAVSAVQLLITGLLE